ncbi:hypothetical protein M885DRAFT_535407, partial [Pelagophyceae sp. CCMP2097]
MGAVREARAGPAAVGELADQHGGELADRRRRVVRRVERLLDGGERADHVDRRAIAAAAHHPRRGADPRRRVRVRLEHRLDEAARGRVRVGEAREVARFDRRVDDGAAAASRGAVQGGRPPAGARPRGKGGAVHREADGVERFQARRLARHARRASQPGPAAASASCASCLWRGTARERRFAQGRKPPSRTVAHHAWQTRLHCRSSATPRRGSTSCASAWLTAYGSGGSGAASRGLRRGDSGVTVSLMMSRARETARGSVASACTAREPRSTSFFFDVAAAAARAPQ